MVTDHPYIDFSHGAKVIGDEQSARQLFLTFIEKLPSYQDELNALRNSDDLNGLSDYLHSLKGATCYTSTPALHYHISRANDWITQHHGLDHLTATQKNEFNQLLATVSRVMSDLRGLDLSSI